MGKLHERISWTHTLDDTINNFNAHRVYNNLVFIHEMWVGFMVLLSSRGLAISWGCQDNRRPYTKGSYGDGEKSAFTASASPPVLLCKTESWSLGHEDRTCGAGIWGFWPRGSFCIFTLSRHWENVVLLATEAYLQSYKTWHAVCFCKLFQKSLSFYEKCLFLLGNFYISFLKKVGNVCRSFSYTSILYIVIEICSITKIHSKLSCNLWN